MWFLLACIIASFILQWIISKNINKLSITYLAIALYGFALFGNLYYFVITGTPLQVLIDKYIAIFYSVRNGLFLFIFFWEGFLLSGDRIKTSINTHKATSRIIFILFIVIMILETWISYGKNVIDDNGLMVSLIVIVPLITCFSLFNSVPIFFDYRLIRNMSAVIYFAHPFFASLLTTFFGWKNGIRLFLVVFVICVILHELVSRINNPIINKIFATGFK